MIWLTLVKTSYTICWRFHRICANKINKRSRVRECSSSCSENEPWEDDRVAYQEEEHLRIHKMQSPAIYPDTWRHSWQQTGMNQKCLRHSKEGWAKNWSGAKMILQEGPQCIGLFRGKCSPQRDHNETTSVPWLSFLDISTQIKVSLIVQDMPSHPSQ